MLLQENAKCAFTCIPIDARLVLCIKARRTYAFLIESNTRTLIGYDASLAEAYILRRLLLVDRFRFGTYPLLDVRLP